MTQWETMHLNSALLFLFGKILSVPLTLNSIQHWTISIIITLISDGSKQNKADAILSCSLC